MAPRDEPDGVEPNRLARFAREPLVQFFAIGAAVFALYGLVTSGQPDAPRERDRIVVTQGRLEQLAQVFAKTWQRPPTAAELRGLLDGYIKEEVYYREAVKLGLDRDDTVIRRRMQQKMEFLTEPSETALSPSDDELGAYLEKHRDLFRIEPKVAFEQIFLRGENDAAAPAERAEALLRDLKDRTGDVDHRDLGDPTLLPSEVPLAPLGLVARTFGEAFADTLIGLPAGGWQGPVSSPYGVHLVRILDRREAEDPPLSQVREAVLLRWRAEKREAFMRQRYEDLLAAYDIVLPDLGAEASKAVSERP